MGATTDTVVVCIDDLSASFACCLALYAQWRRRRGYQNHYRRPEGAVDSRGPAPATAPCALTASLAMGVQVREAFAIGLALLGSDYADGDDHCRRALAAQQSLLHDQVTILRAATRAVTSPLDINVILQACETARLAALAALAAQYIRMAAYRSGLPDTLPVPKCRAPSRPPPHTYSPHPSHTLQPSPQSAQSLQPLQSPPTRRPLVPKHTLRLILPTAHQARPSTRWLVPPDDDAMTTTWSVLSSPLVFQSEPPSPPLTATSSDSAPPMAALPELAGTTPKAARGVRPKNSVFHIFCSEALALQVDLCRPVPSERKCRCGYRWQERSQHSTATVTTMLTAGGDQRHVHRSSSIASLASISSAASTTSTVSTVSTAGRSRYTSPAAVALKDGFSLTPRFLAKSHCEGGGGFGCVLCTSTGLATTYDTVGDLRRHINTAHDKWQMLHDRDMA